MSDWVTVSLNEIAFINPTEKLAKGTLATKIGMDNLQPFSKKVSAQIQENYNGGMKFRNGDTIVARITPCLENGKTAYIDTLKDGEIGFGSTEYIVLRAKEGLSNSHFLYYFARSDTFRDVAIASMTGSSGRQRVQTEVVVNHTFELPTLPEQKAIASVLSSLDDKIDLLHRQNKTLEAMAETLFRQWFIEEAKEDWEEKTIGDIFTIKGGGTPSTKEPSYWDGSIAWTSPRDLSTAKSLYMFSTERTITELGLTKVSSGLLPVGTLLMSSRAPIGYLALTDIEVAVNQGYIAILKHDLYSNEFMYLWCKANMELIKNSGNGSVFQEISKASFRELPFVCPPESLLKRFNGYCINWFSKIKLNAKQIQTLENLRDTLLPKLMSGEVRVQYQTEEVA